MSCKYITHFYPKEETGTNTAHINCELIDAIAGHRCGILASRCEQCGYDMGDDSMIRAVGKKHLEMRLISGDSTKYPPMDLTKEFGRYAQMSTRQELADLIRAMFHKQASVSEAEGGQPPEVLDNKLRTLAQEHGVEDAYDEEIARIAAAIGG